MDTKTLEYNIICVKWGDKFTSEHANRLYRMAKRNSTLPFIFYCYTDDPTNLDNNIKVIELDESLNLTTWWWKLALFKPNDKPNGINLYLDLDVVIQYNLDKLFTQAAIGKLSLIDQTRTNSNSVNLFNPETEPYYNSSIMVWFNNDNSDLYEKFIRNSKLYSSVYHGIDRFFSYEISSKFFKPIDPKFYYFRTILLEHESENDFVFSTINIPNKQGSIDIRLNYNPNKTICIFNSCHEDVYYTGMESFFN